MARKAAAKTEENGNDVEEGVTRISITIDTSLRRKLRIAAAVKDMSPGEFAVWVIEQYADKQIESMKG